MTMRNIAEFINGRSDLDSTLRAAPALAPDPRPYDKAAGSTRLFSGLLITPLLFVDLFFLGLSPMATDSCGPDNCSSALTTSLVAAPVVWLVAVIALLVSWVLPARPRFRAARGRLVAVSAFAGLMTFLILANLPTG